MRDRISKHAGTARWRSRCSRWSARARASPKRPAARWSAPIDGHRISSKPYPNGLLTLGKNKKFAAAAIPTVKNSQKLSGKNLPPTSNRAARRATVNLGTWCLDTSPYPLTNAQAGQNNYFFATPGVREAGRLPADRRAADRRRRRA